MVAAKRLPSYAYLSPEQAEKYAEITQRGTYKLIDAEIFWRDRYMELEKSGYTLRPRYHPDWTPSWLGTNLDPLHCEDSVMIDRTHVIDATRRRDNLLVSLKYTKADSDEIRICQFLATLDHPQNHCVPLLEVLPDPLNSGMAFMVMPYLRPMSSPPFTAAGEVVDFISQSLNGLLFLHSQRIAHRDIAAPNIMMDARPLYPHGHHPVELDYSVDNMYEISPLARIDRPVLYSFIDFGISHRFDEGSPTTLLGRRGRNQDVPELSNAIPYDAFKVDVYALGDVFFKEFSQKYHGLEFLDPLLTAMRTRDPAARVSAEGALAIFRDLQARSNGMSLRWRLSARTESTPERMVYSTVAMAREGIYQFKRIMGPG
ncbi:kinase-like domain-containing protein [Daedaleopsis nitida]|nr:kinase-like domain-containing protein [Daedaleopsis nitida]